MPLKPIDKSKNPGLAKLPTDVRNKMGYMKKGGAVKKKDGWYGFRDWLTSSYREGNEDG
jgi:hypothetical protein